MRIEILLYILFFAACRLKAFSVWHRVLYLGAGCCMFTWRPLFPLSAGICFFFAGTLTYFAFQRLSKRRSLLLILGVGLLTFSLLMISENVALHVWKAVFFFRHQAGTISPQAFFDPGRFDLVLFPLLLLTLALWEERRGTLGRRFGFIGNLSYSSYLLHFPLQLVFKIVALSLALPLAIFYSPWTVLLFLLILIPLSLASHRSLELPAQNFLRRKFLRKRAKSVSQAPPV